MAINQITIVQPDDWHVHFRDEQLLDETVPATARCFARAIVMPNLVPPVLNKDQALAYRDRIVKAAPTKSDFTPLMTLYLTNETTVQIIKEAINSEIPAAKLYPAGATTNSSSGVSAIEALYPAFEAMSECGMRLLIHGEVTDPATDIFDREKLFIDQHLAPIHARFPELNIVLEHITTADAVEFVLSSDEKIAATITPQHLLLNRNDLLVGGVKPHNYCLPVLKRNTHQRRLQEAATSGSAKFFIGSDSAPHAKHLKESSCGCAGCYSAWSALELYTEIFDDLGALDKLEGFASLHGPDFYGLARNQKHITLVRENWTVPEQITLTNGDSIVPFYAGQNLNWQVKPN